MKTLIIKKEQPKPEAENLPQE